jgi:hypothetical protein
MNWNNLQKDIYGQRSNKSIPGNNGNVAEINFILIRKFAGIIANPVLSNH